MPRSEFTDSFFWSKTPVFIDIETDWPEPSQFKAYGQLAVKEIKCAVVAYGSEVHMCAAKWQMERAIRAAVERHGRDNLAFVGHNIFRFDAPILKRIWGIDLVSEYEVFDTLLMSKISEIRRAEHSLESYSSQSRIKKIQLETDEERNDYIKLLVRCSADVQLTRALFKYLVESKRELKIPDNPYKVEFRVAEIIARQHEIGVVFDGLLAYSLEIEISEEMQEIRDSITIEDVPLPESKIIHPPKVQFKKDGTPSSALLKYAEKVEARVWRGTGGTHFIAYRGESFMLPLVFPLVTTGKLDLDSTQEIKNYLLEKGWKPTLWNIRKNPDGTYKETSPKLYDENKELCPNLADLDIPDISLISRYLTLKNRMGVLKGWMRNERVIDTGRISPDADTMGAVTGRFTHKIVANVPRVTSPLGKEFRELFRPSKGRVLVGWDASSLEACMEAHYSYVYDEGEYAKELMEGDIHTKNQAALELPSRDKAKTWKYAVTYGARPKKLAKTFGWTLEIANEKYQRFWEANPALKELTESVTRAAKNSGVIRSIDGRLIPVDSTHTALNRLLQSSGAILMKYAMVIADRKIRKLGLAANGLIRYHDEEQWEADPSIAETVGKIGVRSIEAAAMYLKLRIPVTGEYKIGKTWADTH